MVRLLALVLPLCLDTFAVATALGMAGLSARLRLRLGLVFAAFEGGMPLIGLFLGAALGRVLGGVADYVAGLAIVGIGIHMLVASEGQEEDSARRLIDAGGLTLVGLGLSISMDELAIGFALGLARVAIVAAVVLIAVQAFFVSQIGFQVGRRVGERVREGAERMAGIVLICLGIFLVVAKLARFPI